MQKFFAWAEALKYVSYLCDAYRQRVAIQFPNEEVLRLLFSVDYDVM